MAAAVEATAKVSLGETTQEEASESPFLDEILHARSGPTDQTSEPISPRRGIASLKIQQIRSTETACRSLYPKRFSLPRASDK